MLLRLTCVVAVLLFATPILAQTTPCSSPEARQFDFWVGEWQLSWTSAAGTTQTGTNHITPLWDACGVEENFEGDMGALIFKGKSVSMYHAPTGKWRQTWVDNQGGYLEFEGGMEGDSMVLYGTGAPLPDGKLTQTRMTFLNIETDRFDWHWEQSTDEGETWQMAWAIHYQRAN